MIKGQTLAANYKIEAGSFVALSEDSQRFVFIDDNDMHVYLRRRLPFCPLRRPVMNVLTSRLCVPALITNRTKEMDLLVYCDKVISVDVNADPTAEYFGNGYWVIISAVPIALEITCKNQSVINSSNILKLVNTTS